jgi:hypothetical protein
MSNAQQLFVVYGTVILLVGLSLGTILGFVRMKAPPIRTLATAHVETLMQAPIHLALAFAVGAVGFESGWATWGAGLLVAGSGLQAIGVTLNWITNTVDQFAERSPGFYLNSVSTYAVLPGAAITVTGVLSNL